MIFGYFGHFSFLGQKGAVAKFFTDTSRGGENFVRVLKGDKNFRRLIVSDSYSGQIVCSEKWRKNI